MMQRQEDSLSRRLRKTRMYLNLLCLAIVIGFAKSQTPGFESSIEPCPNKPGTSGYTSIEALNKDMKDELKNIETGGNPQDAYIFVLCPKTEFNASSGSLLPLLSGSIFFCGNKGDEADECVITGGDNQVVINDPTIPNYAVKEVSFIGVTFSGFKGSAISGSAGSETIVKVNQARVKDFDATYVIRQENDMGEQPFGVEIRDTNISGGSRIAFSNVGGDLTIDNLSVDSSNFVALVSSGSSSPGNAATTIVTGAYVRSSSISMMFVSMENSEMNVADVTVSRMRNITDVFQFVGAGSKGMLSDIVIRNNADVVGGWTAIAANQSADVTITNLTFADNTNVRSVFSSFNGSTVRVNESRIQGVKGTGVNEEGAIVYGDNAQAIVERMETNYVRDFKGIFVARAGSTFQVRNSCVGPGSATYAAFASANAVFDSSQDFINPSFESTSCPDGRDRLTREAQGSNTCDPAFDSDVCLARLESLAPNVSPPPSGMPSSSPSLLTSDAPQPLNSELPTKISIAPTPLTSSVAPFGSVRPSLSFVPAPSVAPSASSIPSVLSRMPTFYSIPLTIAPASQQSVRPTSSTNPATITSEPTTNIIRPTSTESPTVSLTGRPTGTPSTTPLLGPTIAPTETIVPMTTQLPTNDPSVTSPPTTTNGPTAPGTKPVGRPITPPSQSPFFLLPTTSPSKAPISLSSPTLVPTSGLTEPPKCYCETGKNMKSKKGMSSKWKMSHKKRKGKGKSKKMKKSKGYKRHGKGKHKHEYNYSDSELHQSSDPGWQQNDQNFDVPQSIFSNDDNNENNDDETGRNTNIYLFVHSVDDINLDVTNFEQCACPPHITGKGKGLRMKNRHRRRHKGRYNQLGQNFNQADQGPYSVSDRLRQREVDRNRANPDGPKAALQHYLGTKRQQLRLSPVQR